MIKTQKTTQILKKPFKLVPGTVVKIKITAEGANNVGLNEFSYGMPILVPNAKIGDTVQAKILKILTSKKIAVAKLIKTLNSATNQGSLNGANLKTGDALTVTINKLGPNKTGLAFLANVYNNVNKIIVMKPAHGADFTLNQNLSVTITRVKKDYSISYPSGSTQNLTTSDRLISTSNTGYKTDSAFKGTKFTVVLPKKAKRYLKHLVFKAPLGTLVTGNKSLYNGTVNGFDQTLFKKV